jgi:5-methyltetrahydrofolate--homocysteine methyltransferase
MSRLASWLENGPIITDGAWGTELQARGLGPGECPDFWNLEQPEKVAEVARSYVEAGSKIILTNTFRANALVLGKEHVFEINRMGVEISKRAAGHKARVVASIGPSGKMLMTGEVSAEELRAAFLAQALALSEGGADAIVIETMSDIEEGRLAVEAAKETGLPIIASFAFDSGKNKDRTMMGSTPERVAAAMAEAGADAVGANCGAGPAHFVDVCRRLKAGSGLPVWVKPNAGLPVMKDGHATYAMPPEEFASFLPALLEAGASFVGGCCGTSPAYIRALVAGQASCAIS